MSITERFSHFLADESGATAIEYGLIAALIAVALSVGAATFSSSLNSLFTDVDGEMSKAFAASSSSSSE